MRIKSAFDLKRATVSFCINQHKSTTKSRGISIFFPIYLDRLTASAQGGETALKPPRKKVKNVFSVHLFTFTLKTVTNIKPRSTKTPD